jgi:YebC/PmpR family DNA-binding regulatory protein
MAGHSKWAGIKHKKAIVDAKRGKLFTKLARAITVAAKEGGGDVDGNPRLALAVQKAKDASMPKDNIERAIAKGTGEGADAAALETVVYEGYGPGGVALLVEAVTDNRNRTGSEVRHAFGKFGGSLGEPGSVAYLFDKKGVVVVDSASVSEDDLMAVALDAGAEDIVLEDGVFEVVCEPADLAPVREAVAGAGIAVEAATSSSGPGPACRSTRRGRRRSCGSSTPSRSSTTSTRCTRTSTSTPRCWSGSRAEGPFPYPAAVDVRI